MKQFAKLYEFPKIGQVLVKLDSDDDENPHVSFYFKPTGLGVCESKHTFNTHEHAMAAFQSVDEAKARAIVDDITNSGITQLLANPAPEDEPVASCDAAVAAIQYALEHSDDEPMTFLRLWNEGEFDVIRREWEDVPDEVFIGADPLFQPNA